MTDNLELKADLKKATSALMIKDKILTATQEKLNAYKEDMKNEKLKLEEVKEQKLVEQDVKGPNQKSLFEC